MLATSSFHRFFLNFYCYDVGRTVLLFTWPYTQDKYTGLKSRVHAHHGRTAAVKSALGRALGGAAAADSDETEAGPNQHSSPCHPSLSTLVCCVTWHHTTWRALYVT
jgi:hypothetical protein